MLLYTKRTCIVSADIVQFDLEESDELQTLFELLKTDSSLFEEDTLVNYAPSSGRSYTSFISVKDSVLFINSGDLHRGKVIELDNGVATIAHLKNGKGKKSYRALPYVFKAEDLLIKFKNGKQLSARDSVFYANSGGTDSTTVDKKKATILGLNNRHILLLLPNQQPRIEIIQNIFLE